MSELSRALTEAAANDIDNSEAEVAGFTSITQRLVDASGGNPQLAANVLEELATTLFKDHPVRRTLLDLSAEARHVSAGESPFEYLRGIVASCVRDSAWRHTQDGELSTRIAQDAASTIIAGVSPKITNLAVDLCVDYLREPRPGLPAYDECTKPASPAIVDAAVQEDLL